MHRQRLHNIFYNIKPELRDNPKFDSLRGLNIIEDMEFDSVEIVMLISELENYVEKEFADVEHILNIIQEYDRIEEWVMERKK